MTTLLEIAQVGREVLRDGQPKLEAAQFGREVLRTVASIGTLLCVAQIGREVLVSTRGADDFEFTVTMLI